MTRNRLNLSTATSLIVCSRSWCLGLLSPAAGDADSMAMVRVLLGDPRPRLCQDRHAEIAGLRALRDAEFQDLHDLLDAGPQAQCGWECLKVGIVSRFGFNGR